MRRLVTDCTAPKAPLTPWIFLYVRRWALGLQTPSPLDAQVINELRRLGRLQKHFYKCDPDRGRQYAEILLEITDAIRRVGQPADAV